jgi:hypothetical protein
MFKVIWIELLVLSKRASSDVLAKYLLTVIHSSWASCHSLCIHDIYLVHMHAIGVPEGVTLLEFEELSEEQQPNTEDSGGAAFRRSARRGRRWVPGPSSVQLCERQAPEHYKPPNFWNAIKVLMLYIVALSLGVGWKHLLYWLSNPCPRYYYPKS